LDTTGLYYYNARYYDPNIGRFISPDTIIPQPFNPQSLNRYSYCLNNPLKYIDPTGHGEDEYGRINIGDNTYIIYAADGGFWIDWGDGGWSWTTTLEGIDHSVSVAATFQGESSGWVEYGPPGMHYTGHLIGSLGLDDLIDFGHQLLSSVGCIFDVADLVNGIWYGFEGDWENAAWSYGSILPIFGSFVKPIKITSKGWTHVINNHTGIYTGAKSVFDTSVDINKLIQNANQVPGVQQANGNFARIVNAGSNVGIDMTTGKPTSYYTVITDAFGNLVTTFPGVPK
jgi:RHS repeat-associated protein